MGISSLDDLGASSTASLATILDMPISFLMLPGEIRNQIYNLCLVNNTSIAFYSVPLAYNGSAPPHYPGDTMS